MRARRKRNPSFLSNGHVHKALNEIICKKNDPKLSVHKLSKKYGLAPSSLRWRMNFHNNLSNFEADVVIQAYTQLDKCGFTCTWKELGQLIENVLEMSDRRNVFGNGNMPNLQWLKNFIAKYSNLSPPQHWENGLRIQSSDEWIEKLVIHLKDYKIDIKKCLSCQNAPQIFQCVEVCSILHDEGTITSELIYRTDPVFSNIAKDKSVISIISSFNAAGMFCNPFIISKESYWNNDLDAYKSEFMFVYNQSGRTDKTMFCEWFKLFIREINEKNIKRPVLVLVDRHSIYFSLPVLELAKKNQIILHCLPNIVSANMHPFRGYLFQLLCEEFYKSIEHFSLLHNSSVHVKYFPVVFEHAWENFCLPTLSVTAFQEAGIVPLKVNVVNYNRPSSISNTVNIGKNLRRASLKNPNSDFMLGMEIASSLIFEKFVHPKMKPMYKDMLQARRSCDKDVIYSILDFLKRHIESAQSLCSNNSHISNTIFLPDASVGREECKNKVYYKENTASKDLELLTEVKTESTNESNSHFDLLTCIKEENVSDDSFEALNICVAPNILSAIATIQNEWTE